MDRTYAQKMTMGPTMGNPLGSATMYSGTQNLYAPKMTGGYVGKSRLNNGSNASVRSKSMRSGLSRRSTMSKRKPTKRFNEDLDAMSRKSKPSYHPSRASVKNYRPQNESSNIIDKKKQVIEKIDKMDDNIEKLRSTFNIDNDQKLLGDRQHYNDEFDRANDHEVREEQKHEPQGEEDPKKNDEDQLHDEIDSLYYGYSESRKSGQSRRSQMTSATYISQLEKELQEERRAREKLAQELEEIKKISSEISSHLGLKNTMNQS